MAGLVLLVIAISNVELPVFHGPLKAFPACVGTALIIWSGSIPRGSPLRVLEFPPVIFLGQISYSLYLWHWPLIVLPKYYLVREFTVAEALAVMAASVLAAFLSYKFVEQPFRSPSIGSRKVLAFTGAISAALVVGAWATISAAGFPGRFSPEVAKMNAAVNTHYRCGLQDYIAFGGSFACKILLPGGSPGDAQVVLLGNSHAQMYTPLFRNLLRSRAMGGLLVYANGCLPFTAINTSDECARIARLNVSALLNLPKLQSVIIAFNWDELEFDQLKARQGRQAATNLQEAILIGLKDLSNQLVAAEKRVIVIGPIATPGFEITSEVARNRAYGHPGIIRDHENSARFYDRWGGAIKTVGSWPDVTLIRPDLVQCTGDKCQYFIDQEPLFADAHHIASASNRFFRPLFEDVFSK